MAASWSELEKGNTELGLFCSSAACQLGSGKKRIGFIASTFELTVSDPDGTCRVVDGEDLVFALRVPVFQRDDMRAFLERSGFQVVDAV